MWGQVLTSKTAWGLIITLVILEGLLSADNALVLAVLVSHLPAKQRKKALFYGLIGAYFFRFIAIGFGTLLIKLWFVKLIGALYLMWLVFKFFKERGQADTDEDHDGISDKYERGPLVRVLGVFWATVVVVELTDVSFSVDSILASLGVSQQVWVLFAGAVLGILAMRGVAQIFLILIEKIPEMEVTAYILIAFISVKMILSLIGIELTDLWFFIIMAVIFAFTFIIHFTKKATTQQA
jgi:YkoY family integral membrane protein